MRDISLTGLLYSLPSAQPYRPPEYVPIPLTGVSLAVKVVNFIAEVEVAQEYQNKEENPIEVVYFFPIEEEAAVISCSAELEGRNVVAKINETAKAQKLYDEAVKENKTAFILEETKPDIFQLKIGNLSPGAGCRVKITYMMELPVENGSVKMTIPTTIAPKYVPASDGSEAAKKIARLEYDYTTPAPLVLNMDVAMKTRITSVTSPSHTIVTEITEHNVDDVSCNALVKFEGMSSDMDRDIIVYIASEESYEPKVFVEKSGNGSVATLLSMVPKFELKKQPSEIIFLIDCSGSMRGPSINLAKEALQLFVHSLPVDSFFNIFCFGSRFTQLFPESEAFTDETLESAKQLLQGLDANLGGTEIYQPLETIFKSKPLVGKPRQVFVITDGEVSNSTQCVQLVGEHNQSNRVFTLGIGASADRHLVKGMARAGLGVPSFTTYGENIAGKVLKQLKQSLQPCVHHVQVDWGQEAGGGGAESCQAPLKTPSLYDGTRLLVYRHWEEACNVGDKVTVTAETAEGTLSLEVEIDKESFIEGDLVHKMFARKMIQDLEEKFEKDNAEEVKSLIIELGLKYGLVSKYTSYIGVEQETNKETGVMATRQVRNQVPYGYGQQAQMLQCSMDSAPRAGPMRTGSMFCSLDSADLDSDSAEGGMDVVWCDKRAPMAAPGAMMEEAHSVDITESLTMNKGIRDRGLVSNMEKLLALTSLQTAAGCFKQDKIIETIIGDKFVVFEKFCEEKKIETQVWQTALIIAYIEQTFDNEKDTWELIIGKARDWLGGAEVIKDAVKCLNG